MSIVSKSLVGTPTSSAARVCGLRVKVWDVDASCADLVDVALTDARGHFVVRLDADYTSNSLPRKEPAIVFRIFDNAKPVSQPHKIMEQVTQELAELQSSLATTGDPNIMRLT